jgi:carbon monoxide dehydrogenase subunit G
VIVRVSTELDIPAELAWQTVKKPETFRYVVRGVLGVRQLDDVPDDWGEGLTVRVRLLFFHVIPAWKHEIRIVRLDPAAREIHTSEHGGPVRTWNHRIKIEPESERTCRYTDEIEIRAGPLTPSVWLFAQLIFLYRQRRWRKLARNLRAQASGNT